MKHLYEKNEMAFAIVWIVVYVVSMSVGDSLCERIGVEKSVTTLVLLVMSVFLFFWIRGNHLQERYGLCGSKKTLPEVWFYLPLLADLVLQLAYGLDRGRLAGAALPFVSMLLVGFAEEVIFRGFLFRAMERDGIHSAVVVSALTFGVGHVVNLLNGSGQGLALTLLQIVFACFFGLCMVLLFCYGGSLWPCILVHGLHNALGTIAPDSGYSVSGLIVPAAQMLLMAVYALWLWSRLKEEGRL